MPHVGTVHAGSWTLQSWLRRDFWEELDIRVTHAALGKRAIELVNSPWTCGEFSFRDGGAFLDLTI